MSDADIQDFDRSDFYSYEHLLTDEERGLLHAVRKFMTTDVAPVLLEHWSRATFPVEIVPGMRELGIAGLPYHGYGCGGRRYLLDGMIAMELARTDCSIATFNGVHGGLAMGSVYLCGSEEQRERFLPAMARYDKIGSFGLTEPEVGSGASGGLQTTARRDGDSWILNGQKKWIGNSTFGDLTVVWAKDVADGQVKGFVVENSSPGFTVEKQMHKIALRIVQNGLITLDNVRVDESDRLQLAYACSRKQFGRPIGGFQLVQDLLVRMLGNVTSAYGLCVRLSQLQDEGHAEDRHSSLAKAFCTVRMRETVGWARELLGGNGILLEHNVGRFVADAEAIYSYEGTREMNTLIVGRSLTGLSAFV